MPRATPFAAQAGLKEMIPDGLDESGSRTAKAELPCGGKRAGQAGEV